MGDEVCDGRFWGPRGCVDASCRVHGTRDRSREVFTGGDTYSMVVYREGRPLGVVAHDQPCPPVGGGHP